MRIKFLTDYRGVLTGEMFFKAGEIAESGAGINGSGLVAAGRAELVAPPKAEPVPDPKPKAAPRKRTRKPKAQ